MKCGGDVTSQDCIALCGCFCYILALSLFLTMAFYTVSPCIYGNIFFSGVELQADLHMSILTKSGEVISSSKWVNQIFDLVSRQNSRVIIK